MKKAIFPGTFDPFTNGHLDITERGANMFDAVVVAVTAHNSKKKTMFSVDERVKMIEESCKHLPNVTVCSFDTLLVQAAKEQDAEVMIRGLRVTSDFEYEFVMRQFNSELDSERETVYLMSSGEHMHISSTHVKEVSRYCGDVSRYVPKGVLAALTEKMKEAPCKHQ